MTHRGPPEFRARRMATGIVSLVSRRTASERASPFPKPHPLRSAAHPTCTSLLKCDRIVEPAAAANRVDGRFRGGEHPEPVAVGTDAPARLVRRDHGTVADLFAQRRVGRRGVAGGAVQHVGEAARRHVDAELRPQQVGDLRQRHTHLGVQLDDQGDDAGAELHAGGAQRVGGLQRVAALHTPLTLRAVADLDVKTTHEGAHLGQFFLILRRHAGHFDRAAAVRTGRRDRRPVGLVDLRRPAAAAPPAIEAAPGRRPGRPPRPCRRSLAKGAAWRRPARRAAANCCFRRSISRCRRSFSRWKRSFSRFRRSFSRCKPLPSRSRRANSERSRAMSSRWRRVASSPVSSVERPWYSVTGCSIGFRQWKWDRNGPGRREVTAVARCALRRLSIVAGRFCRMGTVSLPGWRGLQAGLAGRTATPGGARPRGSSSVAAAAAPQTGHAAGTDVANCGERLVGVPVGPATKPTCSGRGRLRPARREMSECGPGPAGGRLAPRQEGGGSARASGTTGARAHSIVVINERGSRLRWRAVRTTLASTCWVSARRRVRLPPHTLRVTTAGRMACSARQLVASIDGSHKKRNTAGNSLAKCLAKRSASTNGGGVSISRPSRVASRPRADRRQTVLTDFARVRAGPQSEAVLQDRLHRARPGAVGMSGLQVLAPSQEVRLMPISA